MYPPTAASRGIAAALADDVQCFLVLNWWCTAHCVRCSWQASRQAGERCRWQCRTVGVLRIVGASVPHCKAVLHACRRACHPPLVSSLPRFLYCLISFSLHTLAQMLLYAFLHFSGWVSAESASSTMPIASQHLVRLCHIVAVSLL